MALELYDPTNHDGLFDCLGKAYYALQKLLEAYGTTVPNAVEAYLTKCDELLDQLDIAATTAGLPAATDSWREGSGGLASALQAACEGLVLELVRREAPGRAERISDAMDYVIDEMKRQGYYVTSNSTGATLTAGTGNSGPQPSIAYLLTDDAGNPLPLAIPETLELELGSDNRLAVIAGRQRDLLSPRWPEGSDCDQTLPILSPNNSLVPYGDMETVDGELPRDWILQTGTEGTHVQVTDPEVQTVTISGTPTGGWYVLQYTDPDGKVWATTPLDYNASGAAVQAALREIPDLATVTVSTSGTSPDYTHTITFTGVGGNPNQLTSINGLTGGSSPAIAHNTTTAGDPASWRGASLKLISDGTTQTTLYVPVTVEADTSYVLHLWAIRSGAATTGTLEVAVVDGIGGSITTDPAGTQNKLDIDVVGLSNSAHEAKWAGVRFQAADAGILYLRLRFSTAPDSGVAVYLDDLVLVEATRLYRGGPALAVFRAARSATPGQYWTLEVTNDRAGAVLEWTSRVFRLDELELALPTSGTTLIPDSVIA